MQEATARLGVTRRRMRCLEREGAGAVVLRVAGPPVEPGSRASGARAGVGTGGGATLRGCRPARRASSVAAGDRPRGVVRRDGDAGRRTRLHGALEERLLADSRSAGSGGWRAALAAERPAPPVVPPAPPPPKPPKPGPNHPWRKQIRDEVERAIARREHRLTWLAASNTLGDLRSSRLFRSDEVTGGPKDPTTGLFYCAPPLDISIAV